MMFKVVTETLGVANVLRTPIYAATLHYGALLQTVVVRLGLKA